MSRSALPSFMGAAVSAVFLCFHVAGRLRGTAGCSTFAHLRKVDMCSQGHRWNSAKGTIFQSCIIVIHH